MLSGLSVLEDPGELRSSADSAQPWGEKALAAPASVARALTGFQLVTRGEPPRRESRIALVTSEEG